MNKCVVMDEGRGVVAVSRTATTRRLRVFLDYSVLISRFHLRVLPTEQRQYVRARDVLERSQRRVALERLGDGLRTLVT